MNKIYLLGDTHGDWKNIVKVKNQYQLDNDYVIVLGDFGFIFSPQDAGRNISFLSSYMRETNSTLLFVDGNHENFELINAFPVEVWNGGKVHRIASNILHLMRGQVFDIEGKSFFAMGGAISIDKGRRIDRISWWQEENITHAEIDEAFNNLDARGWVVDYVLSHTAPKNVVFKIHGQHDNGFTEDYNTKILQEFCDRLTFTHWFFGHHHMDKTVGKFTVAYNKVVDLEGE